VSFPESDVDVVGDWTLVDADLNLLGNKAGATRLGFALTLKFFEQNARFPDSAEDFSSATTDATPRSGTSPLSTSRCNTHPKPQKSNSPLNPCPPTGVKATLLPPRAYTRSGRS